MASDTFSLCLCPACSVTSRCSSDSTAFSCERVSAVSLGTLVLQTISKCHYQLPGHTSVSWSLMIVYHLRNLHLCGSGSAFNSENSNCFVCAASLTCSSVSTDFGCYFSTTAWLSDCSCDCGHLSACLFQLSAVHAQCRSDRFSSASSPEIFFASLIFFELG